jgi:hypothetical protein
MDGIDFASIVGSFLAIMVYLEIREYRADKAGAGFLKTMLRKSEEERDRGLD